MSNKALLIAIVIGLIVLCVVVGAIANGIIRANENVELAKELVTYCHTIGTKTLDECQNWAADILKKHRDEVVACRDNTSNVAVCIDALGVRP